MTFVLPPYRPVLGFVRGESYAIAQQTGEADRFNREARSSFVSDRKIWRALNAELARQEGYLLIGALQGKVGLLICPPTLGPANCF